MGRHFTLDNSSTKHLMHVANKHLGDDDDCEDEVPPRTPLPTTGPDDTEGNCWELVDYDNARTGFYEYQDPCEDRENQPTTCYGDYFPCVWEMVIEGVNPLDDYYELTGECGHGYHTGVFFPGETQTTGKYECVGCSHRTYHGQQAPGFWHHLPTHHEYPSRTRPTVDINGSYIISLDISTHGGDYGWAKYRTHFSSSTLVGLEKDGVTASSASSPDWGLKAYMFFRSCAGGYNYGYPGYPAKGHTQESYDWSNPPRYDMKDGVHLFLLFGDGPSAMAGMTRQGSPYSGFVTDCGYNAANVFAGHLSNFSCSGTNQFTNEFDGMYDYEDNIPEEGVAQLDKVVIPYYAGGSITLYPMPDSFYEE